MDLSVDDLKYIKDNNLEISYLTRLGLMVIKLGIDNHNELHIEDQHQARHARRGTPSST